MAIKREMYEVIAKAFADKEAEIIARVGDEAITGGMLVEFAKHEAEMLANRKRTSGKPTKTQAENESIKAEILELLADGVGRTATEVMAYCGLSSNQKASSLLNQLVRAGKLTKEPDKKKVVRFVIA